MEQQPMAGEDALVIMLVAGDSMDEKSGKLFSGVVPVRLRAPKRRAYLADAELISQSKSLFFVHMTNSMLQFGYVVRSLLIL